MDENGHGDFPAGQVNAVIEACSALLDLEAPFLGEWAEAGSCQGKPREEPGIFYGSVMGLWDIYI